MINVTTRPIGSNDIRVMKRVQVLEGQYRGQLGYISGVDEGCACSAGWIKIYLDSGVTEQFRYGYKGDRSDLALVVDEPNQPNLEFLERSAVKTGLLVKIWPGSNEYGRYAYHGTGEIIELDLGDTRWARIRFVDGFSEWFKVGAEYGTVLVSHDPLPPKPDFLTRDQARRGLEVEIIPTHHDYGRYTRHGKATIIEVDGGEVKLSFADGYTDWFYLDHNGPTMKLVK